MPIFSSPTKDVSPAADVSVMAAVATNDDEYPIGRLGAITRIRKQIDDYITNVSDSDHSDLKILYNQYLVKVENLYEYCNSGGEAVQTWLIPHRSAIESFRETINQMLYPPPPKSEIS